MDQTRARKMFEEGAFFIFLNVPEGTEFGIDLKAWNTGERFRGVKMIPPGLHYIFYSSVSTTEDVAPRIGFLHNFRKGEVLVKKWDPQTESISSETVQETEIVNIKDNITVWDQFLGPYPHDILEKWAELTGHLNDKLVNNLMPVCGEIKSALELQSCSDADRPKGKRKSHENDEPQPPKRPNLSDDQLESVLLPNLLPIAGTELRFTEFPKRNYPENATPTEITQHSMDSSYVLEQILKRFSKPLDLIGELEFAFICFLIGHSLEAFEHWKRIVTLLCSCENALEKHPQIFESFTNSLEVHLEEIPEEFLADIVMNKNFVYVNLRSYFRAIESSNLSQQFRERVERFKFNLTKNHHWQFDHLHSEDEDDAPVLVEI